MNTKHFDDVANKFVQLEQDKLMSILDEWETCLVWPQNCGFENCNHRKLTENIRSEHFMDAYKFYEVLKAIIDNFSGDLPSCLSHVRQLIFKHYLKQGDYVLEQPVHVAASLSKATFANYLLTKGFSKDEIDTLLTKSPKDYNSKEKRVLIKAPDRLVWSTWDEFGKAEPYHFLKDLTAENVIITMALDDYYCNKEMLLFHFEVERPDPSSHLFYRPTWCDSNFFDKFQPTDPAVEVRWGLTAPVKKFPIAPGYTNRRPEGVIPAAELPFRFLSKRIYPLPL